MAKKQRRAYRRCFFRRELALGDGAHGASAGAGTAVQASTGVDHIVISALRDSAHGASVSAGTAADASIGNNVCHRYVHLP